MPSPEGKGWTAVSGGHPATGRALHERSAWATGISIATVYRSVSTLESCGLIERHSFPDGRARFETSGSGHHDHFINIEFLLPDETSMAANCPDKWANLPSLRG
ncbi:transcriptional repressor [Paracoccus sp. J55]|uniref:transcriptional repressor n=1 Tax=Paracoccus sp. J55 TaxID=935849 RepID=UPI001E324A2E|nr:transcriptional repressor [Paracoccus sp. J55]